MTNTNTPVGYTFHESYGSLPTKTMRLIRKYNVSPADFDLMTDLLGFAAWVPATVRQDGEPDWSVIDDHIVSNSETGMYVPRFF